jgi:hypothetical protein
VLQRWSIFKAGSQTAADPSAVTVSQHRRLEHRAKTRASDQARAAQME